MEYSTYGGYEEFQNSNSMNMMNNSMGSSNNSMGSSNNSMGNDEINNIISSITTEQPTLQVPIQLPQQVPNQPQQMENNQVADIQKAIAHNAINNKAINYQMNSNGMNKLQQPQMAINLNDNEVEKKKPALSLKLVLLGLIVSLSVACALAWNEVARYYIGRSIKFYNGKPIYYVVYAISVTIVMALAYIFSMYNN